MQIAESYKILGVPYGSDLESIKMAYRKLAKQYHPDHGQQNTLLFCKIHDAYTSLKSSSSVIKSRVNGYNEIDILSMGDLLIKGSTSTIRKYAARQLGLSGKMTSYTYLRKGLVDKDMSVVRTVIQSIAKLKMNRAIPELGLIFKKSDSSIRKEILEACLKIGANPMMNYIVQEAKRDLNNEIRFSATLLEKQIRMSMRVNTR
ncbi:DnaJ domain-containing protein [Spirochaeta cellobiosiphila]|uniref:DnaJ domain-containing protein n=1 Tax=Spirochaeta cellobiosiphila TaxID=504483 RepID=UPI000428FC6E|nr:DnaJ domain-containing protein [Spirochaeta cellobiosiphila]